MAAAKKIRVDAVVVADLSELDGIFTLKEEQKNGTEGFSWQTTLFSLYSCLALTKA